MNTEQKAVYLHWAEIFDSWRIVPRIFLFGYWGWVAWLTYYIFTWYMRLPAVERGNQESGLIGVVLLTLIGFGKTIWDTYAKSGRDWTQATPP